MRIAKLFFTVGDKRLYTVRYDDFLPKGIILSSVDVTVTVTDVTVSGTALSLDAKEVQFFLAGGTLNETFTVTVQATLSNTEVVTDTIDFTVVGS